MDSIENWLQNTRRTIIGLHRVGENEIAAGFQHAGRFLNHAVPTTAVQQSVLRPDNVKRRVGSADVLEIAVLDLHELI